MHVAVYTDGGVIGRNPSTRGGTWAWIQVGVQEGQEKILAEACGTITPAQAGLPAITNNYTELLAAIQALEALPEQWAGTLYTDSLITLRRIEQSLLGNKPSPLNGIPDNLRQRLVACKRRLGPYSVRLLGGHPTKLDLARGYRADGKPCSRYNVYCDATCQRLAKAAGASL
jgi:ribonuclease HI